MIFNKSLELSDYDLLKEEVKLIESAFTELDYYVLNHEHRVWEYAMALKALEVLNPRTVLDVGSGGSAFPYILHRAGYAVECLEGINQPPFHANWPWRPVWHVVGANSIVPAGYDVVTAISVVEHVLDDLSALQLWWDVCEMGMFLTYDCSVDGRVINPQVHYRTYTVKQMADLVLGLPGAVVYGDIDGTYHGDLVVGAGGIGSFGSMLVVRT